MKPPQAKVKITAGTEFTISYISPLQVSPSSSIDFKYFSFVSHSLVQDYHSGSSETSDEASRQMVITVFANNNQPTLQ